MVIQHNPNPARVPEPGPRPPCEYFNRSASHIAAPDRPRCPAAIIFDGMCAWHCDMLYGRAWYALWNAHIDGLVDPKDRTALESYRGNVCDPMSYRQWIEGEHA